MRLFPLCSWNLHGSYCKFLGFLYFCRSSLQGKRWIILFLSFNFQTPGNVLRNPNRRRRRVLLKNDRPQCLYLALERRKRCFSGHWCIERTQEISFVCVTVSFTARNASLYILQGSIPWSNIHMLQTLTCTHTHSHMCASPKNVEGLLLWAGSKSLQRETQWWCL